MAKRVAVFSGHRWVKDVTLSEIDTLEHVSDKDGDFYVLRLKDRAMDASTPRFVHCDANKLGAIFSRGWRVAPYFLDNPTGSDVD